MCEQFQLIVISNLTLWLNETNILFKRLGADVIHLQLAVLNANVNLIKIIITTQKRAQVR